MADTFFGLNTGDPEVESSVQVGASTNSTDIELRVTHNDIGVAGQKITRQEVARKLRTVLSEYIESGQNTTWPLPI
jgi:hypothetical protein